MSGEPRTLTHSVDIDLVGVAKLKSVSPEPSDQGVINGETTILRFRVQDGERITLDMGRRQVEVVVNPRAGGGYPVVARADAAELRAALVLARNVISDCGLEDAHTVAWQAINSALAASEGQP